MMTFEDSVQELLAIVGDRSRFFKSEPAGHKIADLQAKPIGLRIHQGVKRLLKMCRSCYDGRNSSQDRSVGSEKEDE